VLSQAWDNLPVVYKVIRKDTVYGQNKYNGRIVFNGRLVAIGQLNKDNIPHGDWFIEPKEQKSSCWGKLKNGRKTGKWWCLDSFYIKFGRNGKVTQGHALP